MPQTATAKPRPRSPHLQIYKPQLSSVLSIFHRIAGVGLTLGAVIFVWWLYALAGGAETYTTFTGYAQTWFGQLVLFGLSAAFFYHLCAGVRHMLWDIGAYIEITEVYRTGRIMVATVIIIVALVWLKIYGVSL